MVKIRPLAGALGALLLLLSPAAASAQQFQWYLAEGATGPFFEQEILVVNPTTQPATAVVTVYRNGQSQQLPQGITIPPLRRITLPVNSIPGLETGETSALIDTTASGVPIFVERTMYWVGKQGGHNAGALPAPSQTWHFAEGATGPFFETFLLLVNPQTSSTNVTLSLLRDDGLRRNLTYTLPAGARRTVYVDELADFADASFGATVTANQAVFAERAMYFNNFAGGHDATGVTALSTTWRFAEGFTGGDFQTYFLVSNPGNAAGTVTLNFFLDNGATVSKAVPIGATSRVTVNARNYPELADAAFATTISSTVPVVAERAVYWGGFGEGHATAGLTTESNSYVFAEGIDGAHGGLPYETFFLFLNSSASAVNVTGTFYREDGYGTQHTFTVPANSRYTLFAGSIPHVGGQKFGAVFQGNANFLVERAVYWGAGRFGGHASAGTPWTGAVGLPANPPPPPPVNPEPPPPTCRAIICDDLAGGTVGQQIGGGFDDFGFVITNPNAGIRYELPTLTSGYFEFEATGMRVATWSDKWKIMGMYDGNGGWASYDLHRFSLEHRYRPDRGAPWDRFLRLKVLNGNGDHGAYIETDTAPRAPWNPNEIYKFRFEWGGGRARFTVSTLGGAVVGHIDQSLRAGPVYAPPVHMFSVGNPVGGDHGSVPGLRIRNVRIGAL